LVFPLQIYVFSTQWANRSADAVMQEHYPSIIAWHESQPETKKHLEVKKSTVSVAKHNVVQSYFFVCLVTF
jgi:hypothetical protein